MQLVELMDLQGAAVIGIRVMLNAQLESNPELVPYRGILEDWAQDIFSTQEAAQAFARLYAETFTEAELRDLVAFYQSPAGRRITAEQHHISVRAEEIGRALAQAHTDELLIRLERAMSDAEQD